MDNFRGDRRIFRGDPIARLDGDTSILTGEHGNWEVAPPPGVEELSPGNRWEIRIEASWFSTLRSFSLPKI